MPETPLTMLDRMNLENQLGTYEPPISPDSLPNVPYRSLQTPMPNVDGREPIDPFVALKNQIDSIPDKNGKLTGGSILRNLSEVSSRRYPQFIPGDYNNEDAYALGQGWASKMVNGVGKGLVLTGTTFLQSTAGLVNGIARWIEDGRAASFYDNDFNRSIDELNSRMEDILPNYYTDVEKNARWYSPSKLFTANFLWDGITKNLGFAAGAFLSGGAYTAALKSIPLTARLFSVGKAAEALAATEEGLLSAGKAAETFGKVKNLSDKFLSSYSSLNTGGRALVAGLSTTGEASFEAYQNLNKFRNEKIQEYVDTYGEEPKGEALERINREADSLGNSTFLANVALLSATNYIQFPKILGSSYTAEKGIINGITKEIEDLTTDAAGNLIKREGPKTTFGKILSAVNKGRKYTFSTSEAFEEGGQFAISAGTEDYYNKKYRGNPTSFVDSLIQGVKETFTTDEGMENVLIGGLSGALMLGTRRFTENRERERNTADAISKINKSKLSQFTIETMDAINRGVAIQEDRENALKQGQIAESKDLEMDYIVNYLTPRIKYGRFDLVKSDIEQYRVLASTEEGFAQLQAEGKALENDTREAYLKRLNNLEVTAENFKSLWQSLNIRYSGILDENNKLKYPSEVMDKMLYAATKVSDYDNRIPRISESLSSVGIDVDAVINDVASGKNDAYDAALAKISQLASDKKINDDQKQDLEISLNEVSELTLRRQKFMEEYNEMKKDPSKFRDLAKEEIPTKGITSKISIRTADGVKDYDTNVEYFLGNVIEYDKDGYEVYRFPRLTLLGENEDGTIKIKDSSGRIRDISKDLLLDYKLGKVSSVESNENANFYLRNINNVVYWNTGKDKSGKVQGRLSYDSENDDLYFVYKDKKGKIKSVLISLDSFSPKEGFSEGVFSFGRTLTAADQTDISNRKTSGKTIDDVNKRRSARLEIINNLFNSLSEKFNKASKLIDQKYAEFEKITNELTILENKIKAGEVTKRSNFKKVTANAIKAANRLSRMQEQLRLEIQELEAQRDEIEFTQSYLMDLAQNIDELPTDSREFLQEIKDQVSALEDLLLSTGQNINSLSKIIDNTEKALESALDFIRDLIGKFESTYPKVPTIMGQEWVDFLKANPNFLRLNPFFKDDLATVEDMIAQVEDLDVVPNERTVRELREEMQSLQEKLSEYEKQLIAKSSVLSVFEDAVKKYEEQKEQERILLREKKIMEELLGTKDNGSQTTEYSKTYEPESKKETSILPRATVASTGKPHHERANRFGINLGKFREAVRNKIRGVYITANNEDQLIPGLIDHLRTNSEGVIDPSIPRDKVIALVMVAQEEDGSLTLVDVNGEPLAADADKINSAIYQVYPEEKLEWDAKWSKTGKAESMFRKEVPEEVQAAVRKQYAAWRKVTLEKTTLDPHEIAASFGIPSNVKKLDDQGNEKTDYDASTSVAEAGLVTDEQLERDRYIEIAKNNDTVSEGTVSFKTPLGRVFLRIPGIGLVKLKNRRLTKTEVNTIYEAIYRLSQNMVDPKKGIKSDESKMLVSWLKSVIYWGTPRQPGYNSVWFDFDETTQKWMLNMSGKGKDFPFTPSSIKQNKAQIIEMLSLMYNNVNSTLATGKDYWNKPYYEIIGFDSDGKPITRTVNGKPYWPNYQTFLLSKQGRKPEELPLSTIMRPLKNEDDYNREGVYFYTTDNAEEFPTSAPKPIVATPSAGPTVTPSVVAPGKPEVAATFDLGGEVTNTVDIVGRDGKNYGPITFKVDGKKLLETGGEKGLSIEFIGETVTALASARGIDGDGARGIIAQYIAAKLSPQLQALQNEMNKKEEPTPTPVQPTAPTPVVTATPAAPTTPSTDPSTVGLTAEEDEMMRQQGNKQITDDEEEALREIVKQEIEKFQPENWKEVEDFLKKNFPNIPVYRVKNIIQATNGRQAWGMLKNGAIYIYENAEVGTAYHEIFEAVWKHFSDPSEQKSILNEFKSRQGSFVDRVTGQEIKYKDATYQEAKEQLAEEFRDYVRNGTVPPKPGKGRPFILKLFYDIKNFIEEFFTGKKAKSNTEKLFEKIGSGYYKNYSPYHSTLAYAKKGVMDINDAYADGDSEFSLIGITGKQRHEIIEHMTYVMLTDMIKSDESLFKINEKLTRKEVYDKLKAEVQTIFSKKRAALENDILEGKYTAEQARPAIDRQIALWKNVTSQWDQLVKMHEDYLKIYSIEFDENDEVTMKSDERSKESGWHDANKIDTFRKANNAVKMLLATVPVTKVNEQGKTVPVKSSIGGNVLLPVSKVYISLMNNIHDAVSVEDMLNKIRKMAETDPNYRSVYKRLTKSDWSTPGLNLSKIEKEHGLQLISAFWKTFKKQNPEVKNVFVLDNGDVVVGDASLSSAARQVQSEFEEAIIGRIREGKTKYFKLSEDRKKYVGVPEQASKIKIGTIPERVEFLKGIGIDFDANDILRLSPNQIKTFKDATDGIARSIKEAEEIFTASGKILKLKGRLLELGVIKSAIEHPEFDSTFFNLNGERVQSFIGTNAATELFEFLSQLPEFTPEALQGTKFEYLLTDSFAKGSTILERMFKESQRIKGSEGLLKSGYVDGFVNEQNGKRKESSKLNYRERLIQELNLNLAGYYLNLVPGDASMEHMMYMGNVISANDLRYGYDLIYDVFGGYFKSELELSREDRPIQKIKISDKQKKQGVQQRNSTDLRFFKTILGKELHDKIVKDKEPNIDKVYENYKSQIDKAIKDYVSKQTSSFKKVLNDYNILKESEEGIIADGINLEDASLGMDEVFLDRNLEALTVNYMISNIEMHKLLYADPYQYSDELKRIKNFLSPRQALISNSPEMNAALNAVWNKGYKPGDIGYTDMNKDEFVSVAVNDIEGVIDIPNYDGFEETDGSGIMIYKAYRNFRIRSSDWNDNEELQYRYEIAWEKRDKSQGLTNEEIEKRGLKLSKEEMDILNAGNPGVRSAYTARKPIVAGNKNDGNLYNDPVLDKFAIYPLSYRVMKTMNPESNAVKLYNKMQAEGIDYVVFKSGRKVGATETNDLYNEDGSFNTTPFKGQTNIPFSIISVQSEVPSKEDEIATRGSQVTKLVTMDFMESGVPIDFKDAKGKTDFSAKRYKEWMALSQEEKQEESTLYKELMNNQKLLEALIDEGYNNLLKSMGIEEVNGEFKLVDKSKAGETLRREVLKREVNDNTIDALEGFLRGDVVLEATPAYQQIRNILYSIADREVVSQKISGGMKVQIPSTLLESVRAKKTTINGKTGYTSDVLKFYEDEDGKRVCEIMVGRWFDSSLSDEELIAYLNKPENQEILKGMAFRIPTQKQNSIDVFKIKQFLPREFGDNVVIPAALVKKVGSDFDIDKLTVYLKNVYENVNGELKAVPFFGYTRVEAKAKFDEMFDSGEFLNKKKLAELDRIIEEEKDNLREIEKDSASGKLIANIFKSAFSEEEITKDFINYIVKSTKQEVRDKIFDKMYKKSLENAYIKSGENLISSRENFDKLITPNSAKQLQDLAGKITEKLGLDQFDYSSTGNMLNRHFMSRLRHAFVTGKYAIGIAAVNQTSHSLNQRQPIYVDFSRLSNLSKQDIYWLTKGTGEAKDADIKFKNYNRIEIDGKMVPTLSMIKNAAGQYISDINGQFIDGYVDISKGPWIMELGATPNVAGTWLFLVKLGVPIDTVAYFMNQPIIRDYLRSLENAGYSYVFNDTFVNLIKEDGKYALDEADSEARLAEMNEIPSEKALLENIGKKSFNNDEKAQQHFILGEFLKYAKMAEQAFYVTQGSNFDTATFNDPYLVFRKAMQFKKAQNTIISSVDEILENSFLGKLAERIFDFRNAYSTILRSDTPNVRNVMEKVLLPYVDMNDRDFVKVAQKAVADLFDWAVQNDRGFNKLVQEVLLEKTGVAGRMFDFVRSVRENPEHPLHNNHIINILEPVFSKKIEGGVNNLKIKGRDNKVYDQNNIIFAFRELKESVDEEMYKGLMNLAVLQSGIANSPISFTSLLPYEDFKELYNETLSKLETLPNLESFYNLNVFERNNWNNDDIVPYMVAKFGKSKKEKWYYNLPMNTLPKNIKAAISNGEIPQMLNISAMSREATKDVIVYRWEKKLSKSEKKKMREKGDYSYIQKGLFKKVYDASGNPFIYESVASDGKVYRNYVYKMINAWGDSFRANEFYDTIEVSKIDNGFIKVQEGEMDVTIGSGVYKRNTAGETADAVILDYYINADKKNIKPVPLVPVSEAPTTAPVSGPSSETKINIYAGTGENAELSNFATRPFEISGYKFNSVEQAFQEAKYEFTKRTAEDSQIRTNIQNTSSVSAVKKLGSQYPTLDTKAWDSKSSDIMKRVIKLSFEQNPTALAKLLATGNATLTHTQDKGKWGTEFPRLLMEVREELRGTQAPTADEATLKSQIAALEEKMRKTGLGPSENAQLRQLQTELGKLIKSRC